MKEEYSEKVLTGKLIGFIFDVYNQLGFGLPEKVYQRAFEEILLEDKIQFTREKYSFIKYNGKIIGKFFLDFLVDGKVAIELKVRNQLYPTDINQLLGYMRNGEVKIGLLFVITPKKVEIKRLII